MIDYKDKRRHNHRLPGWAALASPPVGVRASLPRTSLAGSLIITFYTPMKRTLESNINKDIQGYY